MEFHISMSGSIANIGTIERAVQAVDPSAVVDIDPLNHAVRVAASLDAAELASLVSAAGIPLAQHQVTQVPSTCCGGCSS